MATLFQRKWRVTVDGIQTDGLRMQFTVKKTLKKDPNTLDLVVTNYSETTRTQLKKPLVEVTLEAGYADSFGVLFSGDARDVSHARQGADWETKIRAGEGEASFVNARINKSYKRGVPAKDVIKDIAQSMGLNVSAGASGLIASIPNLLRGFAATGNAGDALTEVTNTAGLEWSIQNKQLQIVGENGENGMAAILISPETGLVGSPDHGAPEKKGKPPTLRVTSLLNHEYLPGRVVVVRSAFVTGEFVIHEVTHKGDSHGNDWFSDLVLHARKV